MTLDAVSLLLFLCLQNARMDLTGCSRSGPAAAQLPDHIRTPALADCRTHYRVEVEACIAAAETAR